MFCLAQNRAEAERRPADKANRQGRRKHHANTRVLRQANRTNTRPRNAGHKGTQGTKPRPNKLYISSQCNALREKGGRGHAATKPHIMHIQVLVPFKGVECYRRAQLSPNL